MTNKAPKIGIGWAGIPREFDWCDGKLKNVRPEASEPQTRIGEIKLLYRLVIQAIQDYLTFVRGPGRIERYWALINIRHPNRWEENLIRDFENLVGFFDHEGNEPFSLIWTLEHLTPDPHRAQRKIIKYLNQEKPPTSFEFGDRDSQKEVLQLFGAGHHVTKYFK